MYAPNLRSRSFRLIALLGILVVVASCATPTPTAAPVAPTQKAADVTAQAPAATKAPAPPTAQPAASADGPRKGGTIVVSIAADPAQLNIGTSLESNDLSVGTKIFNTLLVDDATFTPQPAGLAESYQVSPDGKTLTFKLRSGVKWQDGQAFTCADVAFTFDTFLRKYSPTSSTLLNDTLEGVQCTDDLTAVFKLKAPSMPLLAQLGQMDGGVVLPKHLLEGQDPTKSTFNQKPIGTGPFMLSEWVRGDHITLVRNPNYFMKGRPFLDKIIYKIIPNAQAATAAFEAGEIDYIQDFRTSKSDLDRFSKMPGVQIGYDLEPPKRMVLEINNVSCKLCTDINVRRAISAAIDRDAGIKLTRFGAGTPVYGPIAPQYAWAYNKNASEPHYDVAAANKLLDDAGYKRGADGTRFSLGLTVRAGDSRYDRPADVIREQLKAVGIDLKLRVVEKAVLYDQVYAKYDFDIYISRRPGGADPATGIFGQYTCDMIDPKKTNVNSTRYCNKDLDALIAQAGLGMDKAERAKLYYQVQDILTKDIPIVDLWIDTATDITRKDYVGHFQVGWPADSNWDYVWSLKGEPMAAGSYEPPFWLKK